MVPRYSAMICAKRSMVSRVMPACSIAKAQTARRPEAAMAGLQVVVFMELIIAPTCRVSRADVLWDSAVIRCGERF